MLKYRVWLWDNLNRRWNHVSVCADPSSDKGEFLMETRNIQKAQQRVIDFIKEKNYALLDPILVTR